MLAVPSSENWIPWTGSSSMCSVHGIQFSSLAASNFTTTKSVCGFLLGLILLMKEINLFQPLFISSVASQYALKTETKDFVVWSI